MRGLGTNSVDFRGMRAFARATAATSAGEGALQRWCWLTGSGTASVTEVNCQRGRKVPRSAGPDARTA